MSKKKKLTFSYTYLFFFGYTRFLMHCWGCRTK